MKDLLVYVPPGKQAPQVIDYAVSLAASLDAHLEGVTFSFLPELAGYFAGLPDDLVERIQQESEAAASAAAENFIQRARTANIQHAVRNRITAVADASRLLGHSARCFDMAIVPQTDLDSSVFFNPSLEDTMFVSGRPTLFVPTIHRGPASLDRILVCWDGGRWAARAAGDALPLMKLAKSLDVLQIGDAGEPDCAASDLVAHLRRHGLKAAVHMFGGDNPDIGAAILSFAADCGATLIVMGGYGHSRAREMLFGGATREILQSMTVPVLMSH